MPKITNDRKRKLVAIWLLVGVFMLFVQVILGGLTRLTGSGLSMTEWAPLMGFIPPMTHEQWMKAFEGYQQIAQYKYVNNHFDLSEFKFIFYWEWFHRNWARFIGFVFLVPFFYFLVKKYFTKDMVKPIILLFVIGALQGFIGWYMVSSGLNGSSLLRVSHIRLSIHLLTAMVLLGYTLWFALKILIPKEKTVQSSKTRWFFIFTLIILSVQLAYGAFMAGIPAALSAPTWPTINGVYVPGGMMKHSWINDPINVQFIHRNIAYLLCILILIGFYMTLKLAKKNPSSILKKVMIYPLILLATQVTLGVFTVINSPYIKVGKFGIYEYLSQTHQAVAMLLFASLVTVIYVVPSEKEQGSFGQD